VLKNFLLVYENKYMSHTDLLFIEFAFKKIKPLLNIRRGVLNISLILQVITAGIGTIVYYTGCRVS